MFVFLSREYRLDALQPRGRPHIRIGVRIVCVVLETHGREIKAASGLIGSSFVNQKELEIRRAERFFHPQSGRDLNGVAEGHWFLGPLPFYVPKPCRAQHDVWVGCHERCERAEIMRQFERVAKRPGINTEGLSSAKRMLLIQTRLFATTTLVNIVSIWRSASPEVPARMAQEDACVEEIFFSIGLYHVWGSEMRAHAALSRARLQPARRARVDRKPRGGSSC